MTNASPCGRWLFLVAFLSHAPVVAGADEVDPGELGTLVVFVQPGSSPLGNTFEQAHLPEIRALADELMIPLRVIDGVPFVGDEVKIGIVAEFVKPNPAD